MKTVFEKLQCRICESKKLTRVFQFGPTPLANAFLSSKQLKRKEIYYPLDVYFCNDCNLLQLGVVVDPKILFKNYVYVSSTSPVFTHHFEEFAKQTISTFNLNKKSLILDIGSNDGILLQPYKNKGIRVLGIEPAKNIAQIAINKGIDTISKFFSISLSKSIVKKYGYADIITATNVFAHINDIQKVIEGVKVILKPKGIFIVEFPYLIDFLHKNLFDTVYHEHLSYFALKPLIQFFRHNEMYIFDVTRVSSHGGSLRISVAKRDSQYTITHNVTALITLEEKNKLNDLKTYTNFAKQVKKNKIALINILRGLKRKKARIAGYGAPAKGNTLLNYFGISSNILDYIVDDSPYKQNLYTPGTHIPVVSYEELEKNPPDYLLILAWNFADSIMKRCNSLREKNMKFILPAPTPKIV